MRETWPSWCRRDSKDNRRTPLSGIPWNHMSNCPLQFTLCDLYGLHLEGYHRLRTIFGNFLPTINKLSGWQHFPLHSQFPFRVKLEEVNVSSSKGESICPQLCPSYNLFRHSHHTKENCFVCPSEATITTALTDKRIYFTRDSNCST